MNKNYKIGIDIGSTTVKLVIMNQKMKFYIKLIKDIYQIPKKQFYLFFKMH